MTGWAALATEAWHFFGIGVGQAQILMIGISTATVLVVSYRFATRGKRYRSE